MKRLELIKTKLHIPKTRSPSVPRRRLMDRLDQSLQFKLTLVSSPAGFGKSTLLSDWANIYDYPVAWLSLDKNDNDAARFWCYTITALQTIYPHTGETTLAALLSPQAPPLEDCLSGWINEIVDAPSDFILVLDDYHLIEAEPIHQSLNFLLDHLPSQMHVVIATRSDPPIFLNRLRGRGYLAEIRSADLRFTTPEADSFLNQIMNLGLSGQDVIALGKRTEGWIVGLQLAALSMHGHPDRHAFVTAFTGSDRYITDYLVDEVLQKQAEHIQKFLLKTSILERMCGPLCCALIERDDCQNVLERLEEENLFIHPLDNRREWFRYHQLFADLLRHQLHQTSEGSVVRNLHQRASEWFEKNGFISDAINHAHKSENQNLIIYLVEKHTLPTFLNGEVSIAMRWLESLPEKILYTRPRLSLDKAWTLSMAGQPLAVRPYLDAAEVQLQTRDFAENPDRESMKGEINSLRAFALLAEGKIQDALSQAHQALEWLSPESFFARVPITIALAEALRDSGDYSQAVENYVKGIELALAADNAFYAYGSTYDLCMLLERQGKLREAIEVFTQTLTKAKARDEEHFPAVGILHTGLGILLYRQNLLGQAETHLRMGQKLDKAAGHTGEVNTQLLRAYLSQVKGRKEHSERAIRRILEIRSQWDEPLLEAVLETALAGLYLIKGELEPASRWADALTLAARNIHPQMDFMQIITFARVRLAEHYAGYSSPDLTELFDTLEQMRIILTNKELWGRIILILPLQALALQAMGDTQEALAKIDRALEIAKPQGYIRVFLDEGQPMCKLLKKAAAQGIAVEYIGKLLPAFEAELQIAQQMNFAPLRTPLSERELQVLRLLVAGLSSTEVAKELFIEASTARTHIKNIYRKLDVHRRLQAIERARELKLV